MNFRDQLKSDFDEIFLKEFGQEITLERNGKHIATIKAIVSRGDILCSTDSDIRAGDVLIQHQRRYDVRSVSLDNGALRVKPNFSPTAS